MANLTARKSTFMCPPASLYNATLILLFNKSINITGGVNMLEQIASVTLHNYIEDRHLWVVKKWK